METNSPYTSLQHIGLQDTLDFTALVFDTLPSSWSISCLAATGLSFTYVDNGSMPSVHFPRAVGRNRRALAALAPPFPHRDGEPPEAEMNGSLRTIWQSKPADPTWAPPYERFLG